MKSKLKSRRLPLIRLGILLLLAIASVVSVVMIPDLVVSDHLSDHHINLLQQPVYVRESFQANAISQLPASGDTSWKKYEGSELGNREAWVLKRFFSYGQHRFLSPVHERDREYTMLIPFNFSFEELGDMLSDPTFIPGIHLSGIGENWEVYLNGILLRSEVFLNELQHITTYRSLRDVNIPFDKSILNPGVNVLAFRFVGSPSGPDTGFYYVDNYVLDEISVLQQTYSDHTRVIFASMCLFIGILHIFLYLGQRKERVYLYFAAWALVLGFYYLMRSTVFYPFITDTSILNRIEYTLAYFMFPPVCAFLEALVTPKISRLTKIFTLYSTLLAVANWMFSITFADDVLRLWQYTAVPIVIILTFFRGPVTFFKLAWNRYKDKKFSTYVKSLLWHLVYTPLGNLLIGILSLEVSILVAGLQAIQNNSYILSIQYVAIIMTAGAALVLTRKVGELYEEIQAKEEYVEQLDVTYENSVLLRTRELSEIVEISKEASLTKSRFVSQLASSFLPMLSEILQVSTQVLHAEADTEIETPTKIIRSNADTLLTVTSNALTLSRMEIDSLDLIDMQYELIKVLENTLQIVFQTPRDPKIQFTVEWEDSMPSLFQGDPLKISEILVSLISNAYQFTKSGSITLTMSWTQSQEGAYYLVLSVKDTGIGMRWETLCELFSPGKQLVKPNVGVMGLSIDVARRLAKEMGGDLRIESEYGEGSVFTLLLHQRVINTEPVMDDVFEAMDVIPECSLKRLRLSKSSIHLPKIKGNVLLIDDLKSDQELVSQALTAIGLQVSSATSWEGAEQQLNTQSFDIIFINHSIPGLSSQEISGQIRARGIPLSNLPILMLTVSPALCDANTYKDLGFDGALLKPIDITALELMVRHFLKK
jgi:signal transduction histidine kinase/CheY-like chemotaxis protein